MELLVAQDMLKIFDKVYGLDDQEQFIEKIQAFRTNLITVKATDRKLLGKNLTQDGITYLLAILSKCIQDNSGYK